jgi:purine nucleoside phosphorylase
MIEQNFIEGYNAILAEIIPIKDSYYLTGRGLDIMLKMTFQWDGCNLPKGLRARLERRGYSQVGRKFESINVELLPNILEWVDTANGNLWLDIADSEGGFYNLFKTLVKPENSPKPQHSVSEELEGVYHRWYSVRKLRTPSDMCFVEYRGSLYTFNNEADILNSLGVTRDYFTTYEEFTVCRIDLKMLRALISIIDALGNYNMVFIGYGVDLTPSLNNFLRWEAKKAIHSGTIILFTGRDGNGLSTFETFGVDAAFLYNEVGITTDESTKMFGVEHITFLSAALELNQFCGVRDLMVISQKLDSNPIKWRASQHDFSD